jgi:hypothetical protein
MANFQRSLNYTFHIHRLYSTGVITFSWVHVFVMLLPTVGNSRVWCSSGLQWHNVHTRFHENWSPDSKVKGGGYAQAVWWSYKLIIFLRKDSGLKSSPGSINHQVLSRMRCIVILWFHFNVSAQIILFLICLFCSYSHKPHKLKV